MEENRPTIQYPDICVCCGRPVPEGYMICHACETGNSVSAPYCVNNTPAATKSNEEKTDEH